LATPPSTSTIRDSARDIKPVAGLTNASAVGILGLAERE